MCVPNFTIESHLAFLSPVYEFISSIIFLFLFPIYEFKISYRFRQRHLLHCRTLDPQAYNDTEFRLYEGIFHLNDGFKIPKKPFSFWLWIYITRRMIKGLTQNKLPTNNFYILWVFFLVSFPFALDPQKQGSTMLNFYSNLKMERNF